LGTRNQVNILLVDDQPANLLALEALLGGVEATLVRAASGQEALKHVLQQEFAAILMDLRMPTMDGLETAQLIRSHPRTKLTPIIFVSAADDAELQLDEAYALGAVDFLTKPLHGPALVAKANFFVDLFRSKQALHGERAFLGAVLEAIEDGIVACDADGALTLLNRASREFHGLPPDATPVGHWNETHQLRRPDGSVLAAEQTPLWRALNGEHVRGAELVIAPAGGGQRTVVASGRPLYDGRGRKLGAFVSMHDLTARHEAQLVKQAYAELQAANERSSAIFRQAPAMMAVLRGPEHRFELTNDRYVELVGGREVVGKTVKDALPEVEEQGFLGVLDRVYRSGEPFAAAGMPVMLSRRPGQPLEERILDFACLPLRDADERVSGILIHAVDLTERKRAEDALKASEERVRVATDAAGLGLWTWEPESDTVVWENERPHEIFGTPRTEQPVSASRFVAEFVHPDDVAEFQRATARTLEHGDPYHFCGRIRRADGEVRWVEFRGRLQQVREGQRPRMLGTAADVTEAKAAEESLRASEERYRNLFSVMDEGFCLIEILFDGEGRGADYRFVEANPAFAGHTGLKEAVGKRVSELVPDLEPAWVETYARVARTGESKRFVLESKPMGRWFDVYATRVGGPDSRKVAILFTDITARHRADEELRRLAAELSEADRRKNEFLATLAHELRNPLAPLRNGLHVMRVAEDDRAAVTKARDMMDRQLSHMVHLVNDLLDVARISSGKLDLRKERVELQSVITAAIETSLPLIEAERHELHTDVAAQPLAVDGDPTRLAQVVSNLLNNAAKYTRPNGRIELRVRRDGQNATISVADTGIGIPAASLPAVFEMFAQVEGDTRQAQGGLGIGLSLVRRITQMHGGDVTAMSDGPGQGSTFTVSLPLAAPHVATEDARLVAAPDPAAARPLRILVVDDNVDAAESLALLLQFGGHQTRIATTGPEALRTAMDHPFDLVFLDIGLPGMSGYEVAERLRDAPGRTDMALVALTGWGAEDDRRRSSEAGFDYHLTKPADLNAVQALLDKLSGTRHQETTGGTR
jgi:PAS domain S-box-containing protein